MKRILVTGFHGSGVSLLGNIIADAGCRLRPSDLNVELLNGSKNKLSEPDSRTIDFCSKFAHNYVIADPEFCLTLAAWKGTYDNLVYVVRHPIATAHSLAARFDGNIEEYRKLYWHYYRCIKPFLHQAIIVSYDELVKHPVKTLRQLSRQLRLKLRPSLVKKNKQHTISDKQFVVARKEFCIHAMRRSGHHAIAHWLLSHHKKWFFKQDPRGCRNCTESRGGGIFDCVAWNIEDSPLEMHRCKVPIVSGTTRHIIVIRDPFNLMASRCRKSWTEKNKLAWCGKKSVLLWKEHAEECLRLSEKLPNPVIINYNAWVVNEAYRKEIEKQLRLHNVIKFEGVPGYGGGSSFDSRNFDGKASKMDVLGRWRQQGKDFWKLFDDETWDLARKLFNMRMIFPDRHL